MSAQETSDFEGRSETMMVKGPRRWRWHLSEFDQLQADPRFRLSQLVELIGGELVPMSVKTDRHELLRVEIANRLGRNLPDHLRLMSGLGWRPGDEGYYEPDLVIFESCGNPASLSGSAMLLIIEIGTGEMVVESEHKAALYSALGVRDYWVVNAQTLETRVYRSPASSGYGRLRIVSSGATVTSLLVPQIELKFSAMGLGTV